MDTYSNIEPLTNKERLDSLTVLARRLALNRSECEWILCRYATDLADKELQQAAGEVLAALKKYAYLVDMRILGK